jgi:hypothetical protein
VDRASTTVETTNTVTVQCPPPGFATYTKAVGGGGSYTASTRQLIESVPVIASGATAGPDAQPTGWKATITPNIQAGNTLSVYVICVP